jgi:hypothetical protein
LPGAAREEIERRADADQCEAGKAIAMLVHPLLLLRRADSDKDDIGP